MFKPDETIERTAQQIKEAIFAKATAKPEPVEPAEILGERGFLFKLSSRWMERWRRISNNEDPTVTELGVAKLVQLSFRSRDGTPVYEDLDVTFLANLPEDQIGPVYRRCLQINGYGIEGGELLLKNLLKTLGADGLYALLASIGAPCPACSKSTAPASSASNGSPSGTGLPAGPPTTGGPS